LGSFVSIVETAPRNDDEQEEEQHHHVADAGDGADDAAVPSIGMTSMMPMPLKMPTVPAISDRRHARHDAADCERTTIIMMARRSLLRVAAERVAHR